MKRTIIAALLVSVALAAAPRPARAWETATNVGLTEAAALGSSLHARLRAMGFAEGLYTPLTVDAKKYPQLFARLALLDPAGGYTPDSRGRMSALGWLVAGAALEEVPGDRGRHHFYDPKTKRGLTGARGKGGLGGWLARLADGASGFVASGQAAPAWVVSQDNDLNHARFEKELAAALAAKTPAEKAEHMAIALLCAGAMTAVLEDLGSPSRVRDDLGEHLQALGGGRGDRGSRFERIAALLYGQGGVPVPEKPVVRASWKDYFTAADGAGLADVTYARWLSSGTLPPATAFEAARAPERWKALVARYAPLARAPWQAASGAVLGHRGACVAQHRLDGVRLTWFISDECARSQLAVIVPEVAAYAAGFLDTIIPAPAAAK